MITWTKTEDGEMAKLGNLIGFISWADGVISWSALGQSGSIKMRIQKDPGIDAAAAKLEAIAKAEVEKLLKAAA